MLPDVRRDPVRGEHHDRAVRHLVQLVHEDGPAALEVGHHDLVVHDLLAHVHRRAVPVEHPLDDLDRPLHPGAERARAGQQHLARRARVRPPGQRGGGEAQRPQCGDAARHRPRAEQRPPWGVRYRAKHHGGAAGGGVQQRRRLHVHRHRALGGQPLPLAAPEQVVHRDDLADRGAQPGPAQLARQQRRGRAAHRIRGTEPADLAAHDEIPELQVGADPAADTAHGQHPQREVSELGRQRGRPGRAVTAAPDLAAAAQAAPHGPRLQPQRGADE